MTMDGPVSPPSGTGTPTGEPTPLPMSQSGEHLDPGRPESAKTRAYLAGSKALDSLSRMVISTESFFHPSNSGTWTADLSAFIKYLAAEFNKRENRDSNC